MTRALLPLTLIVVLALPLLVGCTSGPLGWYYSPAIVQIRNDLPPGSSLTKVETYLDEHAIQYTYYRHPSQIIVYVRNIRRDALVQAEQSLLFNFDANRKLTDIEANPAYTHP